jgi:type IV pilus assembly protein PilM
MFGFGKNKFLGIDIGTSTIKIVEIKMSSSKPTLSNYAWMKVGNLGDIKYSSFDSTLPLYLKKIIKEAGFKSREGYVSIPASGGLITLIEFPEMSREDLDQAIRFEAHKYIPTSLEDVVLSWDIVNKKTASHLLKKAGDELKAKNDAPEPADKIQVLLVAAPKNKVAKYEQLAKNAELELKSIEVESFALLRSLVGNDQGNFVVVDIGARVCNIILIEKGVIKVNRNIDAGGKDITKTIARSMNIDEERAERMKMSGKDFLSKESNITFPSLDLIIGEVKRVLGAFYKNDDGSKIDGVIISGGTAGLSGIDQYFSDSLGTRVIIGNPLRRIEYDAVLEPKLSAIKSQLSVSIGLALKGAEEYLRK